jgi:hypothetical protein
MCDSLSEGTPLLKFEVLTALARGASVAPLRTIRRKVCYLTFMIKSRQFSGCFGEIKNAAKKPCTPLSG